MSRRREIRRRVTALAELRSILGAMRTMALVEIGKLARFSSTQRQMVAHIERAAADFFAFAPRVGVPESGPARGVVAFGSERGFCGGFNESIAAALANHAGPLLVVGRRLGEQMPTARPEAILDGATVAEELRPLVTRLAAEMSRFDCTFDLLHHDIETAGLRRVDPIAALTARRVPLGPFPPRRYVSASELGGALVEHYLPAVLLDAAYSSLLAENRERLRHMEGAIEHIDRDLGGERRRLNALRQEEITEEIELLLLGAARAAHDPTAS